MQLSEIYKWEAEFTDGSIVTEGAELNEAVRFSLLPQVPLFPRHDIVGIPMIRRFGRGFIRVREAGLAEYVHCIVCNDFRMYVRSTDGTVLITPKDYELYL